VTIRGREEAVAPLIRSTVVTGQDLENVCDLRRPELKVTRSTKQKKKEEGRIYLCFMDQIILRPMMK
jgi:hypothetical protein